MSSLSDASHVGPQTPREALRATIVCLFAAAGLLALTVPARTSGRPEGPHGNGAPDRASIATHADLAVHAGRLAAAAHSHDGTAFVLRAVIGSAASGDAPEDIGDADAAVMPSAAMAGAPPVRAGPAHPRSDLPLPERPSSTRVSRAPPALSLS